MRYSNPLSWARGVAMMAIGQMLAAKALEQSERRAGFSKSRGYRRPGKSYESNGKRELDRRCRQIASGQLTASNGLIA